jgi:hypothetical protein
MDVVKGILRGSPALPTGTSSNTRSILERLLDPNPETRLGSSSPNALDCLHMHPFFGGIDWEATASQIALVPDSLTKRLQGFSGLVMVDEDNALVCKPLADS